MREPEFLPDWYRRRLHRSRRGRIVARSAVALSLLTVVGVALSPEQAPAVLSEPVVPAPQPDSPQPPTKSMINPRRIPSGARRALQALHDVLPGGVAVLALGFQSDGGVTTLNVRCTADDPGAVEQFTAGLRGSNLFSQVELSADDVAPGADPAAFALHLTVVPLEAR